ncbi:lupus La protein [Engraulis encrasicolus]|uniref:lupus La protein n=1 Tax=Engraulis encrasicolus TaxID=184585 RepID=UPI002FD11FDC
MAENQQPSQLEKKVADQIEYYFGDHNLVRDKFLKEQLQLDDGWVTLETMLKFNRLKTLTTEEAVIVAALKKSKTGLLEISEDKTKIRRNPDKPLPEMNDEYKDVLKHKSVYVKGFPLDATLDDVKDWVGDKAHIENIQLRKGALKTFKGSIFMVLASEDAAKQFVARDDVKKFKDSDLIVLMKEDYYAKKAEERKHTRAMEKSKARSEKEEKQKQAEEEEMKSLEEQKGCLLRFTGVGDQTSREDFHEVFAGHADIKWIDFTRGAKEGTILFRSKAAEALEKAKAAKGAALEVKGKEVQWEVLEGDAEMDTLKKIIEDQQESHNKRRGRGGHRGGGRGRGRGGRSRDRGGRDHHHPQGKKTKFDSDDEADHTSPKKRALESNGKGAAEPAAKQVKTENGS